MDQRLTDHIATLTSRSRSENFGSLTDEEKAKYYAAQESVKAIASAGDDLTLGRLPLKLHTSHVSPSGRTTRNYWACVFPKDALHKSYALQIAVILSERGIELCCCLGAGSTESKSGGDLARFEQLLNGVKRNLRSLPDVVVGDLRAKLGGEWFLRRQWRLEAEQSDFNDLRAWLDYAGSEASVGASISRYFPINELPSIEQLQEEFRKAVQLFGPMFDAAYPDSAFLSLQPADPLPIQRQPRYWALGTGGKDDDRWPEFQQNALAALGWSYLGDLSEFASKDAIAAAFKANSDDPESSYKNDAGACWEFVNDMFVGDYLIAKQGLSTVLGVGIVESDYRFDPTREGYQHVRKVRWIATRKSDLPIEKFPRKTLTDVSDRQALIQFIQDEYLAEAEPSPSIVGPEQHVPYSVDKAIQGLFIPRAQFISIIEALRSKKNVILQGSPGVGKTFSARRLAYALLGEKDRSRVEMVQFHQSYAYEDFVQGWRPDGSGGFQPRSGVFHDLCRVTSEREKAHVLIIDEINRGNISKIFGELLMLLEASYRGPEHAIPLTYSRNRSERFHVPEQLYVIGLMNTADRSLAMVDYALRRRFRFFNVDPAFGSESFTQNLARVGISPDDAAIINLRLSSLNEVISEDSDLGPGFAIGHSYFCSDEPVSDFARWYEGIIESEVAPLLHEYWFDDRDQAERQIAALRL